MLKEKKKSETNDTEGDALVLKFKPNRLLFRAGASLTCVINMLKVGKKKSALVSIQY